MRIGIIALSAVLVLAPAGAFAQNIGKCGWGSKLFAGQRGLAPQVFAGITNMTSGNQTFAISSGTSGCTQDGVVQSSWQTAAYIDGNMNRLARDISRGHGESLDTLATLMGVEDTHRDIFARTLQQNFSGIFSSDDAASPAVIESIRSTLAQNETLSAYASRV